MKIVRSSGFTLIEIISVLVILGILAAVAVPKYFDLQEDAEKKAALSSVAEAQARIQLSFGQQLLQGKTCEEAADYVSHITNLGDEVAGRSASARFGEFILEVNGTISTEGIAVSASRYGEDSFDTGAKLYLPACEGENATGVASTFLGSSILDYLEQRKTNNNNNIPIDINTTLANGVKVTLGNNWNSTSDGTSTAEFTFQGTGNEKVVFKLQDMNDGTIKIMNVNVYNDNYANKQYGLQLVHSSTVHTSQAEIDSATKTLSNLGFNTNSLSSILEVGHSNGEMIVDKSFFAL